MQRFVCFYDGILTKFACLAGRLNGTEKPKKKKTHHHLMPASKVMQWLKARWDGLLCHRDHPNGQLIRGNQVHLAGDCLDLGIQTFVLEFTAR